MQPENFAPIITEPLEVVAANENQLQISSLTGDEALRLFTALNRDQMTLKDWGWVFRVSGIENTIGNLYLAAPNRAKPPRVFLHDLTPMYAILRILDGVNFTTDKPLMMIITDQGIMHMTIGSEQAPVIGIASEANLTRPRYSTVHLPQRGTDVVVMTGPASAKLGGSVDSGYLQTKANIVTLYRSPWQHRAVTKRLPFTQAIYQGIPDLQFTVRGKNVDVRSQDVLAFWNQENRAVLSVGTFVYQNCLESTESQLVLASPKHGGFLRLQNPFDGGQLSAVRNIRGEQIIGETLLGELDVRSGGIPVVFAADQVLSGREELFGCVIENEAAIKAMGTLIQNINGTSL